MGWSVGYDDRWKRWIGYGVPAWCDHPGCYEEINRGLAYVCGGEPYGGDDGCGLYFCDKHLFFSNHSEHQLCGRCEARKKPFIPSKDADEWTEHQMTDESWADWRKENGIEAR
jgi:hypothetical protein